MDEMNLFHFSFSPTLCVSRVLKSRAAHGLEYMTGVVWREIDREIKKQTCCGKPAYVLLGPEGHGGDEED